MSSAAGEYRESEQPRPGAQDRVPRSAWRLAAALGVAAAMSACHHADSHHEASVVSAPVPAAFVQRIPGTTVTLEMVPVPSEGGTLWMSRTEITWDLYDVYLYGLDEASDDAADGVTRPSKPYVPPDRGFGHAGYPAIGMTFHAAESFCNWLSVRTGRSYRVPTEAEWRRGCGESADGALTDEAWLAANAGPTTRPVGLKRANSLGLHDMVGNAAEWAHGADGRAVACGGSYLDGEDAAGCGARQHQQRNWNESDPQIPKSKWWLADCSFVGLRIVCDEGAEGRSN